jgi:hypothetical protein
MVAVLLSLASSVEAQFDDGRLRLFGHLTQGMAVSDDIPVHGVPTSLTTDLRTVALQFRFAVGDANEVVLQVKHQRLGISPIQQLEDDIEMQWAFYQHRLGDLRVRAGRTPVPFGTFNEMRDVGTVLPFFRVPQNLYPEGTDATDGVVVSYQYGESSGWSAQVDGYVGMTGYRGAFYTPDPTMPVFLVDLQTKRSMGTQLWISTPVPGLRVGGAVQRFEFHEEDGFGIPDPDGKVWIGSLDGAFDRVTIRSEVAFLEVPWYKIRTSTAQAGGWVTPVVGLFGQAELVDFEGILPVTDQIRVSEDFALALNLRAAPNVLLKLEGHRVNGYMFEQFTDPTGPGTNTMYGLASISISF